MWLSLTASDVGFENLRTDINNCCCYKQRFRFCCVLHRKVVNQSRIHNAKHLQDAYFAAYEHKNVISLLLFSCLCKLARSINCFTFVPLDSDIKLEKRAMNICSHRKERVSGYTEDCPSMACEIHRLHHLLKHLYCIILSCNMSRILLLH